MRHVNSLGWEMYATDHEDANGQFEQNFDFADALTTCDRAVFYRYMVEAMAQERGLIATFMPKPFAHLTGNGCHFHMSLWDGDDEPLRRATATTTRATSGSRELAYNFVGGLKEHAKAYIALSAPTVSSYKRLVIGAPTSGATWAPGVRHLRLEQPDDDAPHPRGRAGSRTGRSTAPATRTSPRPRSSPPASTGSRTTSTRATRPTINMYETSEAERERDGDRDAARRTCSTRPASSRATTSCARRSGSVGDEDYVDYFIRCKRREWQAAHEQITQWELDRYLQLY